MKFLKWFLISLGVLILLMFLVVVPYTKKSTKKHSPEVTATYNQDGYDISVKYCSPFKKGRVIFGEKELVPYGEVWRTGANEPTTFETKTDLTIQNGKLPKGKYSLWTIPNEESWEVIFNNDIPGWGVSWGAKAARKAESDTLQVKAPVMSIPNVQESFKIDFTNDNGLNMTLSWDTTLVVVPISK